MQLLTYWRRHVALALTVVGTVALGVGAATAVYAVVDAVVIRSLPVRDPGRLVWMWNARMERDRAPFSALDLADYQAQNTVLDALAPFTNWTANLTGSGDAERLEGVRVAPTFFDVVGVDAALGRTFVASDTRAQVAILTDRLWRRRFGGAPGIVGDSVSLNGTAYTIVGVLPRGFVLPFRDAEIAVPLSIETDARRADRGAGFLRVVARLKADLSLTMAKANLDAIAGRLRRDYPDADAKKTGVNLFPLQREIIGDARSLLWLLLGAVVLLLLVASANIGNLLLVSLASRRGELGLRVALGATRARIVRQLLNEIAVLVLCGGLLGGVVARSLAQLLVWWSGSSFPRVEDVGVDARVTVFAIGAIVAATVICGVIPTWLCANPAALDIHSEHRNTAGAAQGRWRRGFVVVQIAMALTLLVATALTVESFNRLQAVNPGFDGRSVLSVQLALPPVRYAQPTAIVTFAEALRSKFTAGHPDIRDAAAISLLPLTGLLNTQDYRIVGRPEPPRDEIPQAHYRIVTPGYFRIMGITIAGRDFGDADRETTRRVAIVSRTLAERDWHSASPIGEHIVVGPDALEIVGVCDDVKQFGLDASPTADLYVPLRQMPANQAPFVAARMYWVVATIGDPRRIADAVRSAVRAVDKDVATSSTRPMRVMLAESIGARKFNSDAVAVAGGATVLLALLGVYAIAAFSVRSRTREIGIRVALGATPAQVLRPLLAAEWRAIAIGLALGTVGAVFVSQMLSAVLFSMTRTAPLLTAAAAATLAAAAVVAGYLPARRAIGADPLAALRNE